MSEKPYIERALFLIGDQNTGKSTQLRSMFLDWRLGNQGRVPVEKKLKDSFPLSNERWLHIRLSSPHEAGETVKEFLNKCEKKMCSDPPLALRWNFVGALQVTATKHIAAAPDVIRDFVTFFKPERVRAAVISPIHSGEALPEADVNQLTRAFPVLNESYGIPSNRDL